MDRFETAVVAAILLGVSLLLWWRFLPLPNSDLSFYTEPACLLAQQGHLAGPGSQHIDLTYQKGIYFYPPGYFLILAAWLKIFGLSPDSLLGFTHLVHVGFLLCLWIILRFRYECSRWVAGLTVIAAFASIPNGRPDLTASFLSVVAWLVLPEDQNLMRLVISGCFGGATLLVSPAFGVGILASLAVLILADTNFRLGVRFRSLVIWGSAAAIVFAVVLSAVLTIQHSWTMAYVQFKTNAMVRGHQVNILPPMLNQFVLIFSTIPFLLMAVVPALLIVLFFRRNLDATLQKVSLAFLGGTAIWFLLNKSQLLLDHHYLFPSKLIFLGVFCSQVRLPPFLRVVPLLVTLLIGFYDYKANYLYLTTPLRQTERAYAAKVELSDQVGVDSFYFARFYRPGHTFNEEILAMAYWPKYLIAIPPQFRTEMLSGLSLVPHEPSQVIVSVETVRRYGDPPRDRFVCSRPAEASQRLRILGRVWNLPADPFGMIVCSARSNQ
jgi:hypothetical protein